MIRVRRCMASVALGALLAVVLPPRAGAGELLVGEVRAGEETPLAFRLTGKSADDVVGGAINLGDQHYAIARVSLRGLIGAHRLHDAGADSYGEYAVFSSSFSDQTAVGQPWVVAGRYHHCDEPYNSFLAIYRVNGTRAVTDLGPVPYSTLTTEPRRSDTSTVYCFMSAPGKDHR